MMIVFIFMIKFQNHFEIAADASCKLTAKCQHNCRKTPKGGQCSCRSGYKLINNQTCTGKN